MVCAAVLGFFLLIGAGFVAYQARETMQRRFPTVTRYLIKIPVVGKFFAMGTKFKSAQQKVKRVGRESGKLKSELGPDEKTGKSAEEKTEKSAEEEPEKSAEEEKSGD